MARTFDFAVLRLMPDAARGEVVNLGLVVFHEASVDVRVSDRLTRARLLYRDFTQEAVTSAISIFEKIGSTPVSASERHRMLRRVGLFTLGEIGSFTVRDSENYEAHIERLLSMFVFVPRRIRESTHRSARLLTEVRTVFRERHLLAAVGDAAALSEHKIVPEWPLPTKPSLKADLALKNGIMRVAQVVDLTIGDSDSLPSSVFSGVVTLEVAGKEAEAEKRVFAYRARGNSGRVDEALRIAAMHATDLVDLNDTTARESFFHEWITAASQGLDA